MCQPNWLLEHQSNNLCTSKSSACSKADGVDLDVGASQLVESGSCTSDEIIGASYTSLLEVKIGRAHV